MGKFDSKTLAAAQAVAGFASDTVLITRRINTPPGRGYTTQTIYNAAGDLQEIGGSAYYNAGGAVEEADAVLVITSSNPQTWGDGNTYPDEYWSSYPNILPPIEVGDVVQRMSDSKTFTVDDVSTRTWMLPHLEILLKRGGLKLDQP